MPGGHLVYNAADESIDAHCDLKEHVDRKNPCRLNRSRFVCKRGLNEARGRPVGFLMAWLAAAHHADSATSHKHMSRTRQCHAEDLAHFSFAKRSRGRQWVVDNGLTDLLGLERPKRGGEGEEPEGLA